MHCWSCNQKLADECLPRSITAIKNKSRNISKGIGAHDHDKIFHSLMFLIPDEVDDKSSYIFTTEHINQPKIHISSFPVDVVKQLHLQIFKESSKDIKKNLFWYKLFSNGSENKLTGANNLEVDKNLTVLVERVSRQDQQKEER